MYNTYVILLLMRVRQTDRLTQIVCLLDAALGCSQLVVLRLTPGRYG